MRTFLLTLLALGFAACSWAQPLEGPWTVVEVDSGFSISTPRLAAHGDTIEAFYVVVGPGVNQVRHVAYSLSTHQVLGAPVILREDSSGVQQMINAEVKPDGKWAALVEVQYSNGTAYHCAVGNANSHREFPVAFGNLVTGEYWYWSRYLWYGHLRSVPGGGFVVAYVLSGTSGPPIYEYWGVGSIAYVDADSIAEYQDIEPYGMFQGPDLICAFPLSPSLTLTYLRGPTYPSNNAVLVFVVRSEEAFTDSGMGLSCGLESLDMRLTPGGRILALHWDSWPDPYVAVFEMDTLGSCAELGQSSSPTSPSTPAWNSGYGWLVPYVRTCCVLIARLDTSGHEAQPVGVVHERDSVWAIGNAGAALTDDGRVVVAWIERYDLGPGNARLRLATVGWDTYLAAQDRGFVSHPSSFSLSAYPNPFNGTLKIAYTLPRAGNVEVSVFNVLGQKVETLVAGRMESGTHAITWNPECAGGVYFVTLKTEAGSHTAKVLYVR